MSSPPEKRNALLSPADRVAEVLFGLVIALTFTCSISVATSRSRMHELLVAAIACNIAWGIIDGVVYIISGMIEQGHKRSMIRFIRQNNPADSRKYIADFLPDPLSSNVGEKELEDLRKILLEVPDQKTKVKLHFSDFIIAAEIVLLVCLATIPVAIPFFFIKDVTIAIRLSNLIAIVMMFIAGWILAGYAGYNKLKLGLGMTVLGVVLVVIAIVLGG